MQKGLGLGVGGTLSCSISQKEALNIIRKEKEWQKAQFITGIRLGMASLPKAKPKC